MENYKENLKRSKVKVNLISFYQTEMAWGNMKDATSHNQRTCKDDQFSTSLLKRVTLQFLGVLLSM